MNELDKRHEAILVECLRALESGTELEACLSRYPADAGVLRPYLEVRARLVSPQLPEPPPAAYAAGRTALLERAMNPDGAPVSVPERRWLALPRRAGALISSGWRRIGSPLARGVAAAALLLVVGAASLGGSGAAGFDPARDVLARLGIVERASQGDEASNPNAGEGAGNADDGIGNAPSEADPGREQAPDIAGEGAGAADARPEDAVGKPGDVPPDVVDDPPADGEHPPDAVPPVSDDIGPVPDDVAPNDVPPDGANGQPQDTGPPDDAGAPDDSPAPDLSDLLDGTLLPHSAGPSVAPAPSTIEPAGTPAYP